MFNLIPKRKKLIKLTLKFDIFIQIFLFIIEKLNTRFNIEKNEFQRRCDMSTMQIDFGGAR